MKQPLFYVGVYSISSVQITFIVTFLSVIVLLIFFFTNVHLIQGLRATQIRMWHAINIRGGIRIM